MVDVDLGLGVEYMGIIGVEKYPRQNIWFIIQSVLLKYATKEYILGEVYCTALRSSGG